MCNEETDNRRWMDIMKCENSVRETRNWANMCGTTGNRRRVGKKERTREGVRGGGRSVEMWRWAEEEGER